MRWPSSSVQSPWDWSCCLQCYVTRSSWGRHSPTTGDVCVCVCVCLCVCVFVCVEWAHKHTHIEVTQCHWWDNMDYWQLDWILLHFHPLFCHSCLSFLKYSNNNLREQASYHQELLHSVYYSGPKALEQALPHPQPNSIYVKCEDVNQKLSACKPGLMISISFFLENDDFLSLWEKILFLCKIMKLLQLFSKFNL